MRSIFRVIYFLYVLTLIFSSASVIEPEDIPLAAQPQIETPATEAPDAVSTGSPAIVNPPDTEQAGSSAPLELVNGLPVGRLVITSGRKLYQDGNLSLIIPVLDIEEAIWSGTDTETLNKGICLYEYSQLPGEGNRNVSLAGHRNGVSNGKITYDVPFYNIDKLKEGDYLYLCDNKFIYRYLWESQTIIEADDWSPIRTTGYSCLTLTSCHPVGTSERRIVIRGRLDEIIEFEPNYVYHAKIEEALS